MVSTSLERINTAARAMTDLDEFWWEALFSAAILPGWAAHRASLPRELWNVESSDAVAVAAIQAIRDRLAEWAAEETDTPNEWKHPKELECEACK